MREILRKQSKKVSSFNGAAFGKETEAENDVGSSGEERSASETDSSASEEDDTLSTFSFHDLKMRTVKSDPAGVLNKYKEEYERFKITRERLQRTKSMKIARRRKRPGRVLSSDFVPINECNYGFIKEAKSNCDLTLISEEEPSLFGFNRSSSNDSATENFEFLSLSPKDLPKVELDFGKNSTAVIESWSNMFGSLIETHRRIVQTGLTMSQANKQLRETFHVGILEKRGFRFRKHWVERLIVIHGRLLKYYEIERFGNIRDVRASIRDAAAFKDTLLYSKMKPRGTFTLSKNTVLVPLPSSALHENGFILFNKVDDDATNEEKSSPNYQFLENTFDFFSKIGVFSSNENETHEDAELIRKLGAKTEGPIWKFRAPTAYERDKWMVNLNTTINLINRIELTPTLVGIGSVFDHFMLTESEYIKDLTGFGIVQKAVCKTTKHEFSIRTIEKSVDLRNNLLDFSKHKKKHVSIKRLFNEIRILRKIGNLSASDERTKYLLRLYHVYEDDISVYSVTERLEMGLMEGLRLQFNAETYNSTAVLTLIGNLLEAVALLHENNVVALNISPRSIVFAYNKELNGTQTGWQSFIPKLCDFRDSLCFSSTSTGDETGCKMAKKRHNKELEHIDFIAPEFFLEDMITFKNDIYSLGVLLLFLFTGTNPFTKEKLEKIDSLEGFEKYQTKIISDLRSNASEPQNVIFEVVDSMTKASFKKRPSAPQLLSTWKDVIAKGECALGDVFASTFSK